MKKLDSALHKRTDGTIEISITVPWSDILILYNQTVDEYVKKSEIAGFRKGKAPKKLVEEKLDKRDVYEEMIKTLIPKLYDDAVTEHKIKPILSPKVELKEASEGKDWVVVLLTCERPAISLGDYKAAAKEVRAGKAKKKIWVPGKEPEEKKEQEQKPTLDEILTAVLTQVKATIPDLLTEQQVNRLLSDLIDQTKKLGLTVEQYLSSTGKTSEGIRQEYKQQATNTLTLEFALEDIADSENITVEDSDIEKILSTAKSEEERKSLERERYYLTSVLRRQKTLDFLSSL